MAQGEVGAAFTGLELGPDQGGVVDVPAQLPEARARRCLGRWPVRWETGLGAVWR
jgi:hypothetical protein